MKLLRVKFFRYQPKKTLKVASDLPDSGNYCVYVVLSRPRSIIARIIRIYTRDTYTHAAISFCSTLSEMYSFSRKWSYYPLLGRLSCERFDAGFLKRCHRLPGLVIKITLTPEAYEKAVRLVGLMLSQKERYKYDMRGFLGNIFKIGVDNRYRFTCSKFVAYILRECGIAEFKQALSLIRPQTLATLQGDVIYQGDLKQYAKVISTTEIAS